MDLEEFLSIVFTPGGTLRVLYSRIRPDGGDGVKMERWISSQETLFELQSLAQKNLIRIISAEWQ